MAIRPPRPARAPRNTTQINGLVIVTAASLAAIVFGLRVTLALIGVEPWTAAWEMIALPTSILVVPLERWDLMERQLAGSLSLGELVAFLLVGGVSLVLLAWLANKRR